jgi:hypothetical protein
MAIGIILGNIVPSTGPALQKGTLVGASIPIGTARVLNDKAYYTDIMFFHSCGSSCHDVPYPLQSSV